MLNKGCLQRVLTRKRLRKVQAKRGDLRKKCVEKNGLNKRVQEISNQKLVAKKKQLTRSGKKVA